mgnify:FL=1
MNAWKKNIWNPKNWTNKMKEEAIQKEVEMLMKEREGTEDAARLFMCMFQ